MESKEMKQALQDTGMCNTEIHSFLENYTSGKNETAAKILRRYRSSVLNDIHAGQDRLYLIDFILKRM